MNSTALDYVSIRSQLGSVILANPADLSQKVANLTARMINEMSEEDLTCLQRLAQVDLRDPSGVHGALVSSTIVELVKQVKTVLPDMSKLKKAAVCVDSGDYNAAHELLDEITHPGVLSSARSLRSRMPERESTKVADDKSEVKSKTRFVTYEQLKTDLGHIPMGQTERFQAALSPYIEIMINEMSIEKLESLLLDAKREQSNPDSHIGAIMFSSIMVSVVTNALEIRPDMIKLQQAIELIDAEDFDEATTLLREISHPELKPKARELISQLEVALSKTKYLEEEAIEKQVTTQTGKALVLDGMNKLRQVVPGAAGGLPTNTEMGEALDGFHEMTLAAKGEIKDPSLEKESIESLQERYHAAKKEYKEAGIDYNRALLSHNSSIFMPALKRKQDAMKKYALLHNALVQRGVIEDEAGDPEVINQALRQGGASLLETVESAMGVPPGRRSQKKGECIVS